MAHLAFASDTAYLPWCATAIRSCLDRTWRDDLHVHVLHDGSLAAGDGRARLEAMVSGAAAHLHLHEVDPREVAHLPALDRFGRIVWLRFLLPELLPTVDRVLYLDADTLVVDDLEGLLATDLGGRPIGAVANVVEEGLWPHVRSLGIDDPRTFFNSGVLLMDLDRMRADGSVAELVRVATERGSELRWPDQDALNIAFAGRWQPLHPRWNAQNSLWGWADRADEVFGPAERADAVARPGVVHFEGPLVCKPWHALNRHPWRDAYWRTLRRTPWADTEPEDVTLATRLIARLPHDRQLAAFLRLARWRLRRTAGAGA